METPLASPVAVPPSPPTGTRGKFFLYALLIILLSGMVWLSRQPHVQATLIEWDRYTLWENVKRLVGGNDRKLAGEVEGRINFLLLGQGGSKHDGPYLTDTIIVASILPDSKKVGLLSIPRDLVAPIPGAGFRRINNANAIGEQIQPGKGAELATQVVSQILNLPIHYYIRLDFGGFAQIVDQLGGIPINIEQGFADKNYPTDDNGVTTITFTPGFQVLSGERALQFVRSRHGTNGEGSDFARAKRQQQLIFALKDKLLSPATFLNLSLVLRLYRSISSSVETNLQAQEALSLARLLRQINPRDVVSRVFDISPRGLLHETIGTDGAYLLEPNVPDYSELKKAAADLFEVNTLEAEAARVAIENGTTVTGLAEAASNSLKRQGFTVVSYGNATHQDFLHTLLYDYTSGAKSVTRQLLESLFQTTAVSLERTGAIEQPDFRLIIGSDYK